MKLMHREGLTQLELANKIGRRQTNISDIMTGRRSVPKGLISEIVEAFPNIDKDWLLFGEKTMYEGESAEAITLSDNTRPRLPKTFAEGNIEHFLQTKRDQCQEKEIVTQFADYEFTIILKNDRMSPKYQRGDELAFRKSSIVEWGNDYLLDTVEGPKFKKVFKINGGVRCVSYNKRDYPDFEIPQDKIYGFYKCVGVIRVL